MALGKIKRDGGKGANWMEGEKDTRIVRLIRLLAAAESRQIKENQPMAAVQKRDDVTKSIRLIAQAVDKDHGITCSWLIGTSFERRCIARNKSHMEDRRRHGQSGILVGSFGWSGRGHIVLTLWIHIVGEDIHRRPFEVHHLGRHPADGVVHHAVVLGNRPDLQHPLL